MYTHTRSKKALFGFIEKDKGNTLIQSTEEISSYSFLYCFCLFSFEILTIVILR